MAKKDDVLPVTISIPRALRIFVNSRVASGEYSSVSDYVRELIRLDRRRLMSATLSQPSRNSEASQKIAPAVWAELCELVSSGDEILLSKRLAETADLFETANSLLADKARRPEIAELDLVDRDHKKFFKPASSERLKRLQ